jgi:CheY-like chemotaxis protein
VIKVNSEVGIGSSFRVRLLLSEVANPRTISAMEDRVRGYTGARQTILVVDDDDNQRHLVREMLEPLGFIMLAASSGAECLALTERLKPNLILLDVAMPEMDGWEVARELRRIPRERSVRARPARERPAIVMLSAFAPDPNHKAEPDPVHDDYLIKPFDLRQLLGKIHALLDIDWLYELDGDGMVSAPIPALASGALPPQQDIDELIRLGQIGYVRAIQDKLAEIESSSPAHRNFTTHLRVFVDGFDLKRYVAALESVRRHGG